MPNKDFQDHNDIDAVSDGELGGGGGLGKSPSLYLIPTHKDTDQAEGQRRVNNGVHQFFVTNG